MQTHEWTTETVPATDRFGYWQRAVCEGVVGAETVEPHGGTFYARLATRRTADCGFVTFASSRYAVFRTERLARRDEGRFQLSL